MQSKQNEIIRSVCTLKKSNATSLFQKIRNKCEYWHAKTINLDDGKIGKVEMSPVNSLERIVFFLLEINHLLVFSVHTSQSVLACPPPIELGGYSTH